MKPVFSFLLGLALTLVVSSCAQAKKPACVDVEKASAKELQKLKHVGPELAKEIVDYRKEMRSRNTKANRGVWNFGGWAGLMQVPGVKAQICKDNLQLVCFNDKVEERCPEAANAK